MKTSVMTKAQAKKQLLLLIANDLQKSDDLFPDEIDDSNKSTYKPWDDARNELIEEFERRAL